MMIKGGGRKFQMKGPRKSRVLENFYIRGVNSIEKTFFLKKSFCAKMLQEKMKTPDDDDD